MAVKTSTVRTHAAVREAKAKGIERPVVILSWDGSSDVMPLVDRLGTRVYERDQLDPRMRPLNPPYFDDFYDGLAHSVKNGRRVVQVALSSYLREMKGDTYSYYTAA